MTLITDTILGLYLAAEANPGASQYAPLGTVARGLFAGVRVILCHTIEGQPGSHIHGLRIRHLHEWPSEAWWDIVQAAMPYHLYAQPEAHEVDGWYCLDATYRVIPCVCGNPRVLYDGGPLEWCRHCQSRPIRLPLPGWVHA